MSEDPDHIQVSRSDGRAHALNPSVFASAMAIAGKNADSPSTKDVVSPYKEKQDETGEHLNIQLHRSDGAAHDINEMMKAHTARAGEKEDIITDSSGRVVSIGRRVSGTDATLTSQLESHFPSRVRIVHMSDTHNFLIRNIRSCPLPPGDILVHTGNFTTGGKAEEYAQFDDWLDSVAHIYHYRIICLGSRDVKVFQADWERMTGMLKHATHVLCHSEAMILGIRFYGCPWNWGHLSNYSVRPGAPSSTSGGFQSVPEGIDVLLTHAAANGRLDSSGAEFSDHWGSKELLEVIRRRKPGLHLHGHIKDCRRILPAFGHAPLTLNSCMTNRAITVLYGAPQVVVAINQRSSVSLPFGIGSGAGTRESDSSAAPRASGHAVGCGGTGSGGGQSVAWLFELDHLIPPTEL